MEETMFSRVSAFTATLIAGGLFLVACSSTPPPSKTVVVTKTKVVGPPPHAPAHGYRYKHADGVELIYHAGMKVYLVTSVPDHYFWKDNYYRQRGGKWQQSPRTNQRFAPGGGAH